MEQLLTDRLLLRPVTGADLGFVHEIHSLPETDVYNTLGIPANIQETRSVIDGWLREYNADPILGYVFAVELKDNGKMIGMVGMRKGKAAYRNAEVWYKFHVQEWGKGYATEALKAVLLFGFDTLGLHRIEAGCATENIGSVRVLEKVGMQREGVRRKALPLKTGWADNYFYGILASDRH